MNPQLENHKRILGILFVVWGSITLFGLLVVTAVLMFTFQIAVNEADIENQKTIETVASALQYIPFIIIVFFSIPTVIAGVGLLTKKSWGLMFALVIGCLNLLSFPIGTGLGAYTIWVYMEEQKMKKIV